MPSWLPSSGDAWAAIATFLAVLVALFGDWIRAKIPLLQPRLLLELIQEPGRSTTRMPKEDGQIVYQPTWYFYGKVSNTRRKIRAATEVQVSLIRLEEQLPGGNEIYARDVPFEWHLQDAKPFRVTLGPDEIFPVCSIVKDTWVRIHPVIKPLVMKGTWRGPFTAVVTFQAKSIEAESNVLPIQIEWNGKWSDDKDEIVRHLRLRELPVKGR